MYVYIYTYYHYTHFGCRLCKNRASSSNKFDMHVGRGPRLVTTGHKFVQLTTIHSFKRLLHH